MLWRFTLALSFAVAAIPAITAQGEETRKAPFRVETIGYGGSPAHQTTPFVGSTGCCDTQPGCCDNVWAGYCKTRKTWCDPVRYAVLPSWGRKHCGHKSCGSTCGFRVSSCSTGTCGKSACGSCSSKHHRGPWTRHRSVGHACGYGFGLVAPTCGPTCGGCSHPRCGARLHHGAHHVMHGAARLGHGLMNALHSLHHHGHGCGCSSCGGHAGAVYAPGIGYGYAKGHIQHHHGHSHGKSGCSSCGGSVAPTYSAPVIQHSAPTLDAPTLAPTISGDANTNATHSDEHSAFLRRFYGSRR